MIVADDARIAVVLFNLGGPDTPDAVQPFLYNLFNDPAIIGIPQPLRGLIARLISRRRAPIARDIYANLGGGSPILLETQRQAEALNQKLKDIGFSNTKCFISMRYWNPLSEVTIREVNEFKPDHIILFPLYPQYSTTTTQSSLSDWYRRARDIQAKVHEVCCYPDISGLTLGYAELISQSMDDNLPNLASEDVRILFSAHGLPEKTVKKGDPYPEHVALTANAVIDQLVQIRGHAIIDWQICYQSRVGPLAWIGPSIAKCLETAGLDEKSVIVVPISFVSEHSETLVELDIEYREVAAKAGVPHYVRVPTVGIEDKFIAGLAELCSAALAQPKLCGVSGKNASCFDGAGP